MTHGNDGKEKGVAVTKKNKKKVEKTADEEEFDEFPVQDWAERAKDGDDDEVNMWEDNWDDETNECDFSMQIREELMKKGISCNETRGAMST